MQFRNNFKEDLLQALKKRMPGKGIEWQEVENDNGAIEEVINIDDSILSLNIQIVGGIRKVYTDTFLNEVANYVVSKYQDGYKEFTDKFISVFNNFESSKKYIVCSLVNAAKNKHLTSKSPYKKYLDFLVVCRVIIPMGETDRASILITNNTLKDWGITEDELFHAAFQNLIDEEIFHFDIDDVHMNILKEMFEDKQYEESDEEDGEDEDTGRDLVKQMVVCTDENNAYGANVLLKPNKLVDIAKQYGMKEVYIFPCSTKEIILADINDDSEITDMDLYQLNCIVYEVNQTVVEDKIFLSNAVYKLDIEKGKVFKVCEFIERQ